MNKIIPPDSFPRKEVYNEIVIDLDGLTVDQAVKRLLEIKDELPEEFKEQKIYAEEYPELQWKALETEDQWCKRYEKYLQDTAYEEKWRKVGIDRQYRKAILAGRQAKLDAKVFRQKLIDEGMEVPTLKDEFSES